MIICITVFPSVLISRFHYPSADASPGCRAPDVRFTIVKPEATTEQPLAKFETTQIYLPEDFTTADVEFVDSVPRHPNENHAAVINPYSLDLGDDHLHVGDAAASLVGDDDLGDEDEDHHGDPEDKRLNANRKQGKRRRAGSGRRRRIENENGQTGRVVAVDISGMPFSMTRKPHRKRIAGRAASWQPKGMCTMST